MQSRNSRAIETKIHPDFLDTIGKSFKFKHGKGVAEWLKNSLDQYLRLLKTKDEFRTGNWPVFLNLIDGNGQSKGPNLAVIDFGGTTKHEIDKFFLYWGDTSAATHGRTIKEVALTGGHGNGGKFYMREMWREGARFLTWKKGKATSLIVQKMENGETGFFEMEDKDISWQSALNTALSASENLGGINEIVEYLKKNLADIYSDLENQKRGFSVIVGRRAIQTMSSNDVVVGGKWKHQQLIDEICDAQQARRPIRELNITVFVNGQVKIDRLTPYSIEEDENWPNETHVVPGSIVSTLKPNLSEAGQLIIYKSANQLTGRLKDLNSLFISDGRGNPIASYPIHELSFPGYSSLISFFHGEIQLNFPEISQIVTNDRERLVDAPATQLILKFVTEKIWERIQAVEKATRENKIKEDLEQAAKLNETLNKHAQRFLQQVQAEILVDYVSNESGGGLGSGGSGEGGIASGSGGAGKRKSGRGGGKGQGGDIEIPGEIKRIRRSRYPQMLLSGRDTDPSRDDGETKNLTDRHPPLHQDDIDRVCNIWWLNTTHPYAAKALKKSGGPKGLAFKSHHLSMFRDMVQREALRILQRREAELPLDRIENELDEISNRFLAELPIDLVESLLE
ncbi:MAG: hypothetical protein KJZ77_06160 [Anaerolineales bacterium]|nr:hypothetical protein [Anaerolineales bacterium]